MNLIALNLTYTYKNNGMLEVVAQYNSSIQGDIINMQIDPTKSGLSYLQYYGTTNYSFVVDADNNLAVIPYDSDTYTQAQIF
jgi:hypothetical protein